MNASLKKFVSVCQDDDWILPGHGTTGNWKEVKSHNPYLKDL
jgi:hypothetical protein